MSELLLSSVFNTTQDWKTLGIVIGSGIVVGAILGVSMKWRSLGFVFSIVMGGAGAWLYHSFLTGYYRYSAKPINNQIIYSMVGAFVLTFLLNIIFGSNRGKDRTFWRA